MITLIRSAACLFILAGVIRPAQALTNSSLAEARLFDWIYPAEKSYESLLRASKSAGRSGWLVQRMEAGKPIPQASARELAQDLIADQKTAEPEREELRKRLGPESFGLQLGPSMDADALSMENAFAKLNERMTELEATLKVNHYNKQSFPGITFNLRSGFVSSGGSGALQGNSQNYFLGGIDINFDGQSDAGAFNFVLAASPAFLGSAEPLPYAVTFPGGGSVGVSGMGFLISELGLSLGMGGGTSLDGGALAYAGGTGPAVGRDFYLNFANNYEGTPNFNTVDLKVGIPKGERWTPSLIMLQKQGQTRYWPLTDLKIFYAPDDANFRSYNAGPGGIHKFRFGTMAKMETGGIPYISERTLYSGTYVSAGTDSDELRAAGKNPFDDKSNTWLIGLDNTFAWGGELFVEVAENRLYVKDPTYTFLPADRANLKGYTTGPVIGYTREYVDQAMLVVYVQPIGPLTLGLEYSHIDPLYWAPFAAASGWIVTGQGGSLDGVTPWKNPPAPGGTYDPVNKSAIDVGTRDIRWGSMLINPSGLIYNTEKYVLQAQTSLAWISIGVFGGSAAQIQPTGPWVWTKPHFEAGNVGWLMWNRMGSTWGAPPIPFAATPSPAAGTAVSPGGTNPAYYPAVFNRPTDGTAIFDSSGNSKVHWQALSAPGWQDVSFDLVLSEKGLGDGRFAKDSVKYVNYFSGSLRFDLQTLFSRLLPFNLLINGEASELATKMDFPSLGDPAPKGDPDMDYMTQTYWMATLRYGVTSMISLIGIYGMETWRSDHSYYPLNITFKEYGLGTDFDMNTFLSGLTLFVRSRIMYLEDAYYGQRNIALWETALGTRINF